MTPAERLRLPHYVYRLYSADMTLLYVGCTYSLHKRLREHGTRPWFSEVAHVRTASYSGAIEAMEAERLAHRTEAPLYSLQPSAPISWAKRVLFNRADVEAVAEERQVKAAS